ncbi:CBO2463/CBO2479 domain-containing protein [Thermobrachium celere]|uniref:Uncharacterized protein n=1 Tax=Thermobrachium celere DSM 8682 TaxID=941824 RepID=R7RRJ0_9CLOT|nr:CBO2463/CBO2479 domain-containing protein [Thermobrachium celere]GFR34852.1 hypothetical protein TCEA9_06640 [Thermobrachium celere]CDF58817.1 FIG00515389: hypothetical protein [Thermobrachium celere DSM 8682]
MKYADRIIEMYGIITKIEDGAVTIDLKGRLGYMKVPMRMLITDYPLKVGQEVGFKMSFLEVISPEPNLKYVKNIERKEGKEE